MMEYEEIMLELDDDVMRVLEDMAVAGFDMNDVIIYFLRLAVHERNFPFAIAV